HAVGRTAAAPSDRPGPGPQAENPVLRRSHERPGQPDAEDGQRQHRTAESDAGGHRPPAEHDHECRPHLRAGKRPGRGRRDVPGTDGPRRDVLRTGQTANGLTEGERMNREFKTFLAALVLSAILGACGAPAGNGPETSGTPRPNGSPEPVKTMDPRYFPTLPDEFRRIHENGYLTVGMYAEDRFPFFFVDERGELVGSDVEMARDIARQLGVAEVRFDRSARSFEELIDLVAAGRYDMA